LLLASETSVHKILRVFLCWIVATFWEKFFQFPFKGAGVSSLFYATKTLCTTWLTVMKFKLVHVLMVDRTNSSVISMYLIISCMPSLFFFISNFLVCGASVGFVYLGSLNFLTGVCHKPSVQQTAHFCIYNCLVHFLALRPHTVSPYERNEYTDP